MNSDTRAHVHELIDHLPPGQLSVIETLLETTIDDGELTAADRAAIQAGIDESLDNDRGVPWKHLGLTIADFEKMAGEP